MKGKQFKQRWTVDVCLICKWIAFVRIALKDGKLQTVSNFRIVIMYSAHKYCDMYTLSSVILMLMHYKLLGNMWRDTFVFLLHFSRKLCVVKVWLFRQLLCTLSKDFRSADFMWWYPNTLYVFWLLLLFFILTIFIYTTYTTTTNQITQNKFSITAVSNVS